MKTVKNKTITATILATSLLLGASQAQAFWGSISNLVWSGINSGFVRGATSVFACAFAPMYRIDQHGNFVTRDNDLSSQRMEQVFATKDEIAYEDDTDDSDYATYPMYGPFAFDWSGSYCLNNYGFPFRTVYPSTDEANFCEVKKQYDL
ncbi:hypothetical protein ACFLX2_00470 [Candidatus Dependentiae bacterium]